MNYSTKMLLVEGLIIVGTVLAAPAEAQTQRKACSSKTEKPAVVNNNKPKAMSWRKLNRQARRARTVGSGTGSGLGSVGHGSRGCPSCR